MSIRFLAFDRNDTYLRAFWAAVVNTLVLAALGILFATIIGFLLGLARVSPNWLISRLAPAYIETFRNIPLLLQLFFWYFAILRAGHPARVLRRARVRARHGTPA